MENKGEKMEACEWWFTGVTLIESSSEVLIHFNRRLINQTE